MTPDLPSRMRACVTLASAYKLMDEAAGEIERLNARLAEAEALLREARPHIGPQRRATHDEHVAFLDRIDAFLGAKP